MESFNIGAVAVTGPDIEKYLHVLFVDSVIGPDTIGVHFIGQTVVGGWKCSSRCLLRVLNAGG